MNRIEVARIVVVTKTRPYRFLLVQRHDPDGFGHLQWEIPGGKVEPNESIINAGIRELREETGLQLKPDDLTSLGVLYGNEVYQTTVLVCRTSSSVPIYLPKIIKDGTMQIPVVGFGWFTLGDCHAASPCGMLVGQTMIAIRSVFDHLITT